MAWLELKIPPIVIFALAMLMSWFSGEIDTSNWMMPAWVKQLNLIFLWAGLLMTVAGLRSFQQAGTTPDPRVPGKASQLVTSGVYKITRNPMYLGMALILLGAQCRWGALPSLLLTPAFMLYMTRFQIAVEEREMLRLFGDEYARYKGSVGRWLWF